mgnify:CR=1 FL=1
MTTQPHSTIGPVASDVDLERTARAYVTMWNERDVAAIPRLVSETFVMHDPAAPATGVAGPKGEAHGRAGLEQFVELIHTAFPDFEISVLDMLVGADLAMYEVRLTMTHDGPLGGLPPTGRPVEIRGVSVLRFEDGLIAEHRFHADVSDVGEQLGLTFPTILGQLPKSLVGKARSVL